MRKELWNVCSKIPLFQAIIIILIYAKTVKELCTRKLKDPPTIDVIRRLDDIMLGETILPKHGDLGNPVVTILINNVSIPNTLVD